MEYTIAFGYIIPVCFPLLYIQNRCLQFIFDDSEMVNIVAPYIYVRVWLSNNGS